MVNCAKISLTFIRGYRQYNKAWLVDAVRYEQVKYHPCKKDHVDPPIVPSKVLMVHRVKPFKGNPYWEKDILSDLGFQERKNNPVFVKNTPEMCSLLWKVKHLIKITPMQLPVKLPTIDDSTEYYVHQNGRIYDTGKLDPARYKATMDFKNSIKRMKDPDIGEKLRLRWLNGDLI